MGGLRYGGWVGRVGKEDGCGCVWVGECGWVRVQRVRLMSCY